MKMMTRAQNKGSDNYDSASPQKAPQFAFKADSNELNENALA
jgi:hypothetical protein